MKDSHASSVETEHHAFSRRSLLGGLAKGTGALGASAFLGLRAPLRAPGAAPITAVKPKRGGSLRAGIAGGGPSDTLDANNATTNMDWCRVFNLFDNLVDIAEDFSLKDALAEEITPNSNASVWTIRVKKGVTFHDGKELTADDVMYTLRRIWNPKKPLEGAGGLSYVNMGALRKLDTHTLSVPMHKPLACFKAMLADSFYLIVPTGFNPKHPVGTGPFKFKSFLPGQESVFTRNPHYWESGLPYLDQLEIIDATDSASQVNGVVSGAFDCVDQLNGAELATVRSSSKVRVLNAASSYWVPFVMQENLPPFTDNRVRLAMKYIIDRPATIRSALDGYGRVGNDFFGLYDPAYDTEIPQRHQDIGRAKSLLRAAGHSDLRVTLDTTGSPNGLLQSATVFAQQAQQAGVTVRLNNMPPGNYFGPSYMHRPFSQSYWNGQYFLAQVTETNLPTSLDNEPHFISKRYADLFAQANATLDEAKQRDIIHEMMLIDHNEGGYLIWSFPNVLDAYRADVHGFIGNRAGWSLGRYRFKNVWID